MSTLIGKTHSECITCSLLGLSFPISLTNKERDALLVKTLLVFGANMNQQGLNEFTPLDLAIHNQCPEVERVLLEHGAKGSVNLIVQKRTFSKVSTMIIIVLIIIFKGYLWLCCNTAVTQNHICTSSEYFEK